MKLISVKSIKEKEKKVTDNKGIYWWWFRGECVQKLLSKLPEIDYSNIPMARIKINPSGIGHFSEDGELYYALYVGIAAEQPLRSRTSAHLSKGDKVGDSLHLSIGGLLSSDVPFRSDETTQFMIENCVIQYEIDHRLPEKIRERETQELNKAYYPLNQDKNQWSSKATREKLSDIVKSYKASLQ